MPPSFTEDFNRLLADLESPDMDINEALARIDALEERLDTAIDRLDRIDGYLTHPSQGLI